MHRLGFSLFGSQSRDAAKAAAQPTNSGAATNAGPGEADPPSTTTTTTTTTTSSSSTNNYTYSSSNNNNNNKHPPPLLPRPSNKTRPLLPPPLPPPGDPARLLDELIDFACVILPRFFVAQTQSQQSLSVLSASTFTTPPIETCSSDTLLVPESRFNPLRFFLDPEYSYSVKQRSDSPNATQEQQQQQQQQQRTPIQIPPLRLFISKLLKRTQLSHSTFLHALHLLHCIHSLHPYLHLPPPPEPAFCIAHFLTHRLLLGTLIVSAKVLYDDTYDNQAWKAVAQGLCVDVSDVNLLERAILGVLEFRVGACVLRHEWRLFCNRVACEIDAMQQMGGRDFGGGDDGLRRGSISGSDDSLGQYGSSQSGSSSSEESGSAGTAVAAEESKFERVGYFQHPNRAHELYQLLPHPEDNRPSPLPTAPPLLAMLEPAAVIDGGETILIERNEAPSAMSTSITSSILQSFSTSLLAALDEIPTSATPNRTCDYNILSPLPPPAPPTSSSLSTPPAIHNSTKPFYAPPTNRHVSTHPYTMSSTGHHHHHLPTSTTKPITSHPHTLPTLTTMTTTTISTKRDLVREVIYADSTSLVHSTDFPIPSFISPALLNASSSNTTDPKSALVVAVAESACWAESCRDPESEEGVRSKVYRAYLATGAAPVGGNGAGSGMQDSAIELMKGGEEDGFQIVGREEGRFVITDEGEEEDEERRRRRRGVVGDERRASW
ncbi:hypothetical protein HDU79_008664 [Rhizoclosmatium sp. JEL0117]|nr:hypothetical protein HDU79_008664 [Rhizoclosmatium sp. JEL0117]